MSQPVELSQGLGRKSYGHIMHRKCKRSNRCQSCDSQPQEESNRIIGLNAVQKSQAACSSFS